MQHKTARLHAQMSEADVSNVAGDLRQQQYNCCLRILFIYVTKLPELKEKFDLHLKFDLLFSLNF